ncbi:MAG: chromosomal replication initiator protein DnaA [Bacteroidales bacterium]
MNQDANIVWEKCLKFIKDNVETQVFENWFKPIKPIQIRDGVLTVLIPSRFYIEFLEEHYMDLLRTTLRKEIGSQAKLEYKYNIASDKDDDSTTSLNIDRTDPSNKPVFQKFGIDDTVPFANHIVVPGIKPKEVDSYLNPNLDYDSYVKGESNQIAYEAGLAIASDPAATPFNPLMIYGGHGLGKTHIANAIGLKIKELHPNNTVLYINANRFQSQYTDSVLKNQVNSFLNYYQMIDTLILDDVNEFAGKEKTQESFYHIFNHLHQCGKQLILTSDKSPIELQGLNKRLISRFGLGLVTELSVPDEASRKKIIKLKAKRSGLKIPEEVLDYLAHNMTTSIRELEGATTSLLAMSTMAKREINISLAEETVNRYVSRKKKEYSIDHIKKIVCEHFSISSDILTSKTRKREIVQARQLAMYFSKKLTSESLAQIGSTIGGKDHATVIHACKTIKDLKDTNKEIKKNYKELELKLQSM